MMSNHAAHEPFNDSVPATPRRQQARRISIMLVQTVRDFFIDSGPQWVAAVVYYALLSAFPLLLGALALASYVVTPQQAIDQVTRLLGEFMPRNADRLVGLVQSAADARRGAGLASIIVLLWTGSRVVGVLTKVLSIAFDADRRRGWLRRTLFELMLLLTVGVLFVLALLSRTLFTLAENVPALLPAGSTLPVRIAERTIPVLLLLATFFLIYLWVPYRKRDWRAALSGAVVAASLFLLARPVFLRYVQRFGTYNLIYGPVAIVLIVMVWTWVVALIGLFGGEVAAHVKTMLLQGKAAQEVARAHRERSPTEKNGLIP